MRYRQACHLGHTSRSYIKVNLFFTFFSKMERVKTYWKMHGGTLQTPWRVCMYIDTIAYFYIVNTSTLCSDVFTCAQIRRPWNTRDQHSQSFHEVNSWNDYSTESLQENAKNLKSQFILGLFQLIPSLSPVYPSWYQFIPSLSLVYPSLPWVYPSLYQFILRIFQIIPGSAYH